MLPSPCKDCKNRKLKCHSTCDLYKAFDEENKKIQAERQRYNANKSISIISILNNKRIMRNKGKRT